MAGFDSGLGLGLELVLRSDIRTRVYAKIARSALPEKISMVRAWG